MQEQLIELIVADDPKHTNEPDDVPDFGFHHPTDYLSQVCWVLEASNFSYWPRAGGLDDQDWYLIQDVITWFRLVRRLRWELQQGIWRAADEATPSNNVNPLDVPRAG